MNFIIHSQRAHFKFTHFFCLTLPSPKERVIGSKFEMHPSQPSLKLQ
ncbi:MAG: hypothetical protein MUE85_03690 [Microscillaceae bacterium]|nr:hypothetical protein [Microscillaceae bacterium]